MIQGAEDLKIDNAKAISSLEEGGSYKFLGALENVKQEDRIVLQNAAKVYLQRLSIIWSSPLLDYHIVAASNQYACTTKGKLEKELQMPCAECIVNRPKVCRTYWWGVGHSLRLSIWRDITQFLKSCSLRC